MWVVGPARRGDEDRESRQAGGRELVDSLLGGSDSLLEAAARPSTETGDGVAVCPPVHALSTSVIFLGVERVCLSESDPASLSSYPAAAAAAKSLQSCPTLCDPRDSSPPGSPVPGIHQARTLEWVAISFFPRYPRDVKDTACFATPQLCCREGYLPAHIVP